jgi:hypothetical protein
MASLGEFREFYDKVRIHVRGNRQLDPASVAVQARFADAEIVDLTMVQEADTDAIPTNEFKSDPDLDLTDKRTGFATIRTMANDTMMRPAQRLDTIRVKSTYGRNYGQDYGNGL